MKGNSRFVSRKVMEKPAMAAYKMREVAEIMRFFHYSLQKFCQSFLIFAPIRKASPAAGPSATISIVYGYAGIRMRACLP